MLLFLISFWLTPPQQCTQANPYPASINSVCTGIGYPGTSCTINPTCSPIPGKPGTWNPYGYTPKGWYNE